MGELGLGLESPRHRQVESLPYFTSVTQILYFCIAARRRSGRDARTDPRDAGATRSDLYFYFTVSLPEFGLAGKVYRILPFFTATGIGRGGVQRSEASGP